MSNHIEIMSPVGSMESLTAAIQGGADAVYFGVGKLNMRSRSSANFTLDNLKEIAAICHDNNVRSYITVNTVMYDHEMDEMKAIIETAKETGITAIIGSDISVLQYAYSKGVEIHISTQCNITNIEAVKFYASFADVMVTARELNLTQVKAITDAIRQENIKGPSGKLVQIEVFAHGALCMAVSGKCYISLDTMNSSANRGACLQPCRRSYTVKDTDNEIELEVENEYIMSPKDLCTIEFLDKILDAGVRVLKIEGRGRSADYVKTVTSCYKEAATAWQNGNFNQALVSGLMTRLNSVYNRGFWDGYYLGRKTGEWTDGYGSQATKKKVYVGKVTNYFSKIGVAEIKIETKALKIGDEIKIIGPTTGVYEDFLKEIRVGEKSVNETIKGDTCSIPVEEIVRRSDKVFKIEEIN